jgi:hypothetical protein
MHKLVKCLKVRRGGKNLSNKWLNIQEDAAYKKITNCNNVVKLRNIEKHVYSITYKWEYFYT